MGPTHVDAQYAWTKWLNVERLSGQNVGMPKDSVALHLVGIIGRGRGKYEEIVLHQPLVGGQHAAHIRGQPLVRIINLAPTLAQLAMKAG